MKIKAKRFQGKRGKNAAGVYQRECSVCRVVKPVTEFHKNKTGWMGTMSRCAACGCDISKKWNSENLEKRCENQRRHKFKKAGVAVDVDNELYGEMIKAQGYACAICGATEPSGNSSSFYFDHCHRTKIIRQLLCTRCNCGLGQFRDNPELLEKAAAYLKRHRTANGSEP